jgi:hypothetical protein
MDIDVTRHGESQQRQHLLAMDQGNHTRAAFGFNGAQHAHPGCLEHLLLHDGGKRSNHEEYKQ